MKTSQATEDVITLRDCTTTSAQRADVRGQCTYNQANYFSQAAEDSWKAAAYCDKQAGDIGLYDEEAEEYYLNILGDHFDRMPTAEEDACTLAYSYGHMYNDEEPNEEEACCTLDKVLETGAEKDAPEGFEQSAYDFVTDAFTDASFTPDLSTCSQSIDCALFIQMLIQN